MASSLCFITTLSVIDNEHQRDVKQLGKWAVVLMDIAIYEQWAIHRNLN